jgi:hypothetical protein
MSELDYIGADELIFNNDTKEGIYSGGFNVQSIMMKAGMSPIMTLNTEQFGGGEKVSDLFNNLVVPNWTLSYNNRIMGGKYKEVDWENSDDDEEDDVVDDDLHEKLLALVKEEEPIKTSKKTTRKSKNNDKRKTKKHRFVTRA